MNSSTEHKIREWLMSYPGLIEAATPAELWRKAWAMSRAECSVEDFRAAIDRAGFKVSQVRDTCRLALPAAPISSYPASRRV